jgi:hypothetical protein
MRQVKAKAKVKVEEKTNHALTLTSILTLDLEDAF